jgi:hypothetical protein
MKKRIVFFDSDAVYAARFLEYFNNKKEFGYELTVFTKKENLDNYLQDNRIEVLLLGPQEAFEEALRDKVRHYYRLMESRENHNAGQQGIYKYQSVEKIIEEILADCLRKQDMLLEENSRKSIVIHTVFSPVPAAWDNFFAWSLACQLSRRKKVLFIPLEQLPVTELSFLKYNREGLTEFIYYLKGNSNYMQKLKELLNYDSNMYYLSGAAHGFDPQALNKEEIQRWVEELRKDTGYQAVIFYLGYYHEACTELMKLSDQSHILCGSSTYEDRCLDEWRRQLEYIGMDPNQDKFRYIGRAWDGRTLDHDPAMQYSSLQELSGSSAWQQAEEQLKLISGGLI